MRDYKRQSNGCCRGQKRWLLPTRFGPLARLQDRFAIFFQRSACPSQFGSATPALRAFRDAPCNFRRFARRDLAINPRY
jgi:hypothetical protein